MNYEIFNLDCRDVMDLYLPDNSVDAIVTDPPYGLSFMGKEWDHGVPGVEFWTRALRVLKPGGHLLAFGGTRAYHRLVCAIEDAGFEVRDTIMWVYGSGFPKSLDVSKAIDKAAGAEREVIGPRVRLGDVKPYAHNETGGNCYGAPNGEEFRPPITAPATEAARQWQGWGTALKPAFEPLVVAIKPLLSETELDIINVNLLTLEARLWSLLLANAAEKISTSNRNELNAACAIARWPADDCIGTQAALCAQMDTSQFEWATNMSLSIVSSWRSTLVEFSKHGSTSITGTKSSTTTCWKTLNYCLSQITPDTIITGRFPQADRNAPASNAERYFSAELKRLNATQELSAVELAISQDRQNSLDVDASVKHEPICVARKPLIGTVAANVLHWGTGALNIDGCRVGDGEDRTAGGPPTKDPAGSQSIGGGWANNRERATGARWPANLIHDGSGEVLECFPMTKSGKLTPEMNVKASTGWSGGSQADRVKSTFEANTGSAARFFYCAKASKKDRGDGNNHHPTVKPTDLMAYLCRLVTPAGGVVFDPFMGSGSTGKAALREGFRFIGCEKETEYSVIAEARLKAAV